jgi:hypothetical protein
MDRNIFQNGTSEVTIAFNLEKQIKTKNKPSGECRGGRRSMYLQSKLGKA